MFKVGESYYFRNGIYSVVGRIAQIEEMGDKVFLRLQKASCVCTDGRCGEFIEKGHHPSEELEYMGDTLLNIDFINDATPWVHPLPAERE